MGASKQEWKKDEEDEAAETTGRSGKYDEELKSASASKLIRVLM